MVWFFMLLLLSTTTGFKDIKIGQRFRDFLKYKQNKSHAKLVVQTSQQLLFCKGDSWTTKNLWARCYTHKSQHTSSGRLENTWCLKEKVVSSRTDEGLVGDGDARLDEVRL